MLPRDTVTRLRIRIMGQENMTIWLSQQKFPRSVSRPIVDDHKAIDTYPSIMVEGARQTKHLIAHSHERTDLSVTIADRPLIDPDKCMHLRAISSQVGHLSWEGSQAP